MIMQALRRLFGVMRADNFIGFDKYRKRGAYHWGELETNRDYRALIDAIAQYLRPEHTVLDIGCGDGAYMGAVASRVKAAVGVDAEPVAAKLANEQFRARSIENCEAHHLRIDQAKRRFAATGQRFDVVWSADVLEHLPRPQELLELAVQVVKPGGLCIIGTPLFISDALVSPYHVKEYTKSELRALFAPWLRIEKEIILAQNRKDGRTYNEAYYLAVGRATAEAPLKLQSI